MSAAPLLAAMRARWLTITGFVAVTVGSAVATAVILPSTYEATASVLLDLAGSDPLGQPIDVSDPAAALRARMGSTSAPPQQLLRSQLELALSPRVAMKAVQTLNIADSPQAIASWQESTGGEGDVTEWFADRFAKAVQVRVAPASLVIEFTFFSSDPKFTAVVANAFAKSFVDVNGELQDAFSAPQVTALSEASEKSKAKLQAAWKDFNTYQREHDVATVNELLVPATTQLLRASSLLTRQEAWDSAARQRARAARLSVDTLPNQGMANPIINTMTGEVTTASAALRSLEAELGSSHPQVEQGRRHVAELQRTLDAERARLSAQANSSETVAGDMTEAWRRHVAQSRQQTSDRIQLLDKGQPLLQKILLADAQHQYAYQQWQEAITRRALADTRVRLLSFAQPPAYHVSPNFLIIVPGALLAGLLLGVTAAWMRERLDTRVRTASTLEDIGLPLLGNLSGNLPQLSPPTATTRLETGNVQ